MKKCVSAAFAAMVFSALAGVPEKIKAKWFEADISPEVGALIAGYGTNDVSVAQYDKLVASGLCLDDGENRIMIVSLDLLGVDYESIVNIRRLLSGILSVPEKAVLVSCTHTHQGPNARMLYMSPADGDSSKKGNRIDEAYMKRLYRRLEEAARGMASQDWRECIIGFHSGVCKENRNRRYTTEENRASFNAHRPILHKLTTGIADHEVGTIALFDDDSRPVYVIGNWAAHPLTSHAPGLGGLRISSDFPGFYRRYIESETGAKAMFVQGAAGNLVTVDDEMGNAAARRVGEAVAMQSILGVLSIQRCYERFAIAKPRVGAEIRRFSSRLRKAWRERKGKDEDSFEVQAVAVGDVCFVGLPGEVVTEIGLEIKWNSPFARTFPAYLATGYIGYVTPVNLMAAGGYESQSHCFASRDTLKMVSAAQDAMISLRQRLYPEDAEGDDPYPDNRIAPVVNMPGMYKGSKWSN